jgi:phage repressor protein C with HTH and peptisase S24 domain
MSINKLKYLRRLKGLTQIELAKLSGLYQNDISRLESGQYPMSPTYAFKIAPILDCSVESLMDEEDNIPKTKTNITNNVSIDIISAKPCCGDGNDVSEETIGKWVMPLQDFKRLTLTSPDRVKQMQVSGDSMQPTINDGDFILADTSHNVFDVDGIYLIRMISGLAVKRLQAGLNAISIISDNPNYKPIEASIGEVKIIGKVIKILNVRSV